MNHAKTPQPTMLVQVHSPETSSSYWSLDLLVQHFSAEIFFNFINQRIIPIYIYIALHTQKE